MRRMHATLRATLLLAVAVFASSCDELDQPNSPEEAAPADTPAPELAVSYTGIPFGPYGGSGNRGSVRNHSNGYPCERAQRRSSRMTEAQFQRVVDRD